MIQVIVYSTATGRVRRVIDPQVNVPNVVAFLAQAGAVTGESTLVYNKVGGGNDNLLAWQAAVNTHTGLAPDTNKNDWLVGVDGTNAIKWWGVGDPAIDSVPGLTMLAAPWGADATWTYNGTTFTAPPIVKGAGK